MEIGVPEIGIHRQPGFPPGPVETSGYLQRCVGIVQRQGCFAAFAVHGAMNRNILIDIVVVCD